MSMEDFHHIVHWQLYGLAANLQAWQCCLQQVCYARLRPTTMPTPPTSFGPRINRIAGQCGDADWA